MPSLVRDYTDEELAALPDEELLALLKSIAALPGDSYPLELSEKLLRRLQKEADFFTQPDTLYGLPLLSPLEGIFASVVPGENARSFRQLEGMVNEMRTSGSTIHLGLFGPPSAGKTMTAGIIARALERPYFEGSGGSLTGKPVDALLDLIIHLHGEDFVSAAKMHDSGRAQLLRIKPSVLFFDEAHEIPKPAEMMMLPIMEKPYTLFDGDRYYDFRDVLFILGTTDSAMLGKAFRSRVRDVQFVGYSEDSVAQIVTKAFPAISHSDAVLIAKAGKLLPRKALNLAKALVGQITEEMPVSRLLYEIFDYDESGLDRTDRRLLDVLGTLTSRRNPVKEAAARQVIELHESGMKVGVSTLANALAYIRTPGQPRPIGIKGLADKLMMSDMRDIEERVNYLELLGLVHRSSRGIQLETEEV